MRKICHGIAINKKTGKEIRFTVPSTFPEQSVEKLRTNLKIKRLNGTDLSKVRATTAQVCYLIKRALKDERSRRLSELAFVIQEIAEQKAQKEPGLEPWERVQLVADVVVRDNEILSGKKTFEQVYREELRYYRR